MFDKRMAIIPAILTASLLISPVSVLAGVVGSGTAVTVPVLGSSGGIFISGGPGSEPQSQPAVSLDTAVSTVKQAFPIPAQATNFSSGFSKFLNRQIWDLRWMDSQNQSPGLDVQVDAATGEIISMRIEQFFDSQAPGLQIPTLTEADAQKIATNLLTRLDSGKIPELQLQKGSNSVFNPNNYVIPLYSFYWQRTIDGIPFAGDGVTIQINGTNGQVMLYNQNWTAVNTELPDPQKVVSVEKAREIFQADDMLQLQYFLPPAYLPNGNGQDKSQVKLVYAPNNNYVNGAIDALSGEPVQLAEGSFNSAQGLMGWGPMYSGRGSGPLGGGSSQEQEATGTNLISQEAALKIATQWLDLPAGVVFQNASLNSYGMDPEQKVWDLSWGPDPEKGNPGPTMLFIHATVDAVTGKLLSFNNSAPPGGNEQAGQITREQALQIAREFLQKIQPQSFAQVELSDENPFANVPGQNGMESFYFYRTANNVPFMNNGFNITVDTVGKRILNYGCNWSDLELPAPDGVIKPDQANDAYLKGNPLSLSYVQMYTANKLGAVKLVYFPKASLSLPWGSNMLDAKSEALLGWDGQDVANLPQFSQFKDVSGNFAEKEITLLGQAGIFTEYGDQFKPDGNLKTVSLLRAMITAQTGVWSTYLQGDEDILKTARKLGWVGNDVQPAETVNRVTFAQLMIHFLKLDNVAQLKDAFRESYTDTAFFPPETEGYITLGRSLRLFHFDGDQFRPEQPVTRAEAAYALVQALNFKQQGDS